MGENLLHGICEIKFFEKKYWSRVTKVESKNSSAWLAGGILFCQALAFSGCAATGSNDSSLQATATSRSDRVEDLKKTFRLSLLQGSRTFNPFWRDENGSKSASAVETLQKLWARSQNIWQ
jgi:hypothetical protein